MRALALLCLAGCATAAVAPPPPTPELGAGWRALVEGRHEEARRALAAAGDALSRFGAATLAFERADDEAAAAGYLGLLEAAAGGDEGAGALAPAAAARLEPLLEDAPERAPIEDRALAVRRAVLPWQAQVALAELAASAARRRGDGALLEAEARRAGCVREATLRGTVGRLPRLDLDAPFEGLRGARPLERTGCRLLIPSLDGLSGVRVVHAVVDVAAAGPHLVLLSFTGPALARVDGGAWHHHGTEPRHGPRWSAGERVLAAGRHTIELRLGMRGGGGGELALIVVPRPPAPSPPPGHPAGTLATALAADLVGDADAALEAALEIERRPRFVVGLAAVARLAAFDPARPANIGRDAARALLRRVVAREPKAARAWRDLAALELLESRPREAAEAAERALGAAPRLWAAGLVLADAHRARGLEREADQALNAALGAAGETGGCAAIEAALRRARDLGAAARESSLAARAARCDAQSDAALERLRTAGDPAALARALQRRLPTSPDPNWVRAQIAGALLAAGRPREAAAALARAIEAAPRDPLLRVRLADAHVALGEPARARAVLAEALAQFPIRAEVHQAARAMGLPLPLDAFRVDGREVIREFARARRRYEAPAVMVLDRSVHRVFADGAQAVLTHNLVLVQTKDGIERWGEVAIPEGAEVLTLRTHKPDGTVREPEEIFGKPTVSAPDLAVGDYVEWEYLELREPADAFAPGFLGDRFYFQSMEAPLDRSEYLVVMPPGLALEEDRRAGAPAPAVAPGPDGTRVWRWAAARIPQLFAERAAVPPLEWIPSVRVSSGVSLPRWARFLREQLEVGLRASPALRRAAREVSAAAGGDRARLPGALVRWVNRRVEPEADVSESASSTLARGRGNRTALVLALARLLDIDAAAAIARPLTSAAAGAPVVAQEVFEFGELLVRLPGPGGRPRWYDGRLRRAPFGYVPPALQGAPAFSLAGGPAERVSSAVPDGRAVRLHARLGPAGEASASVVESLSGWPAVEWAELLDRAGADEEKLRQEFEQRWLSLHFPGAALADLRVELLDGGEGGARLRYAFTHPELAQRDGQGLRLEPAFFLAQPARRYATEPRRRTTLLLGYDVPLAIEARFDLPPGARVLDPGDGGAITTGPGGAARFAERREAQAGAAGQGPQVILRREWRLPLLRVPPAAYQELATRLRRIDPIERSEIRVALPGARAP